MLTHLSVEKAKPQGRQYKLTDSNGLYLLVTPNGGRYWHWKYRYGGKENCISFGTAKDVKLAEAREKRDDARKLLRSGVDPSAARQQAKRAAKIEASAGVTFETVAREWYAKNSGGWTDRHAGYVLRRMENDLFPDLGQRPLVEIKAPELLACLRKIEKRGAHEMARRGRQYCSAIFCYAIAEGRAETDPAASITKALESAPRVRHLAALAVGDLPKFYEKLAGYDGHPLTPIAIRLLMLTAVRTTELIGARWSEFDIEKEVWLIPAERMKMKQEHLVPLSKQVRALLDALRPLSGATDFLFPSPRNERQPISNNTILYALYRMGYHSRATGHGMRTLFSTTLNEMQVESDYIERQLAHVPANQVRGAYNRAKWLPQRCEMMQQWADFLAKFDA